MMMRPGALLFKAEALFLRAQAQAMGR